MWAEVCCGERMGQKLKIYADNQLAEKLKRGNEFVIKLKKVNRYFVEIYKAVRGSSNHCP